MAIKVGVVFPQTEIGNDPAVIAEWIRTAESLGFDHVIAFDHVLGASTASRPDWRGPYTSATPFHEPFVLFSFMASITTTIELVTAVIILPQRQTALVAKQSASLDVLSRGRLRLGVGTGWNPVEYEGLGENFNNRGKRSEEQIELLRALWANETITFRGKWHSVTDAGLNPLPIRRNIPIWLGGMDPRVVDRVGRSADGWFPQFRPGVDANEFIGRMRRSAEAAGRDPQSIGVEVMAGGGIDGCAKATDHWRSTGDATHIAYDSMRRGLTGRQHVDELARLAPLIHR